MGARYAAQNILLPALGLTPAAQGMAGVTRLGQGVLTSPALFTFANGGRLGLAGEAGPEAILPLTRTRSGDLGVRSQSAAPNVVIHNHAAVDNYAVRTRMSASDMEIVIARVQDDVARGGTALARTFERTYGLRR